MSVNKPKLLLVASVPLHLYTFWVPYAQYFQSKGWIVDGASANISTFTDLNGVFNHTFDIGFIRNPFQKPFLLIQLFFKIIRQIQQIVSEQDYDLVHVNTPTAAFMVRFALRNRNHKPRVLYTAHGFHFFKGNSPFKNIIFKYLEKTAARWTDQIFTINDEDYNAAREFGTINPERVTLIPGIGVDVDVYKKTASSIRAELKLERNHKLLLMIGEMNPGKRHKDAIEAISLLDSQYHLAIAGTGKLQNALKEYSVSKGVEHRVHFLGFRKDVPGLISESDALLLPSEREGLPRCILEAMSIGTPVIASDIRGSRDLLANGCGLLHKVGNTRQLAECIDRCLSDKMLREACKERAIQRIVKYSQTALISVHEQIYGNVLRQKDIEFSGTTTAIKHAI